MKFGKFDDIKKAKYLGALRQGLRRGAAARAAGISRETVRSLVKNDKDFARQQEEAEADACDIIEDALFQKAKSGNVTACIYWLQNRSPDRWQDKRNPDRQQQCAVPDFTEEQKNEVVQMIRRLQEENEWLKQERGRLMAKLPRE